MCVGIGDFPITRLVSYTFVVRGIIWNWLWGPELYWCVMPNMIWFNEIALLIKGVKGYLIWVITTRVFPHSHDCGQRVVNACVYRAICLRIKSVLAQFLLGSDLATPWLVVALHHTSNMKTPLQGNYKTLWWDKILDFTTGCFGKSVLCVVLLSCPRDFFHWPVWLNTRRSNLLTITFWKPQVSYTTTESCYTELFTIFTHFHALLI